MDVYVEKLEDQTALCVQTVGDDDAETFSFTGERACDTATEICEELAKYGYADTDIFEGDIGGTSCIFLITDPDWRDVKAFVFGNKDDLRTAYEMANYFLNLKDSDDYEGEDSDC